MFSHYLSTALRHFQRQKLTTAINVVSLAIGLGAFLGLFSVVAYLGASDSQWPGAARIYAITQKTLDVRSRNQMPTLPAAAFPTARYLRADMPELEAVVRATSPQDMPVSAGVTKSFAAVRMVDPDFLRLFPLPVVAGDSTDALRTARSAVLSDELARNLFGSAEQAVGRTLRLRGGAEVEVKAVLGDIPRPSHLTTDKHSRANQFSRFDALVSMDVYESSAVQGADLEDWLFPFTTTYVLLPQGSQLTFAQLRERLESFGRRHVPADRCRCEFSAVPVRDVTMGTLNAATVADRTGFQTNELLLLMGALVLLISCVNYANLASAQTLAWVKEVGLRRVVGAGRGQIVAQCLIEATLVMAIAFALAFALVVTVGVLLDPAASAQILRHAAGSFGLWVVLAATYLGAVLVAGGYPAFVLSSVRPAHVIRGAGARIGRRRAPQLLVALQFTAASFLLITVLVMQSQHRAVERLTFAAMTDPVVIVSNDVQDAGLDFKVLRAELLRSPAIKEVGGTSAPPWGLHAGFLAVSKSTERDASRVTVSASGVRGDFFGALDFRTLAGRTFDPESTGLREGAPDEVVIDRAMVRALGWSRPEEAVNQTLYRWTSRDGQQETRPLTVVGVVETRPLQLIGFGATAALYMHAPTGANQPVIRVDRDRVAEATQYIDATWERLAPDVALKRDFGDERMRRTMGILTLIGSVVGGVAAFALVAAILGLIGMSIHYISRRTHEIGVRKTLGAGVQQVLVLLLRDLSKPVILANVIAWPFAFLAMRLYLNIFVERSALSPLPFALGLAGTLVIAWLAIAVQATRAARVKPVEVLRYE